MMTIMNVLENFLLGANKKKEFQRGLHPRFCDWSGDEEEGTEEMKCQS